jgi:hypothetical protein
MTDLRLLLSSVALLGMLAVPVFAAPATCESLASLSLPNITVTAAQTVPAGNYTAANGQTYSGLPTSSMRTLRSRSAAACISAAV